MWNRKKSFSLFALLLFEASSQVKFSLLSFVSFTVKPIAVHITTREKFVSAEKRYDVECKSSGSRPEAVLTWWKGSRQIKRMAKNVSRLSLSFSSLFTQNRKMIFSYRSVNNKLQHRQKERRKQAKFVVILMMFVRWCLDWWVNRQLRWFSLLCSALFNVSRNANAFKNIRSHHKISADWSVL